jgi:hypothetical protein
MKVSCQFYTLAVHTEYEAKFCPLHDIPKKKVFHRFDPLQRSDEKMEMPTLSSVIKKPVSVTGLASNSNSNRQNSAGELQKYIFGT